MPYLNVLRLVCYASAGWYYGCRSGLDMVRVGIGGCVNHDEYFLMDPRRLPDLSILNKDSISPAGAVPVSLFGLTGLNNV